MARWVREVSDGGGHAQACQGDVALCIDDEGTLTVTPEFARSCDFRGGYDDLLTILQNP